jgi:pyruvate ferredoxin oxidoreductase gamma subunit
MIEIRIHGRGGQGVVTAAELIAAAAFYDGKYAQAFPFFGVERRGAPIMAFARISDQPIRLRAQIYQPEFIIIQDSTLLGQADIFQGATNKTKIIMNSEKKNKDLGKKYRKYKISAVPATQMALDVLGKPIVNTAILGAFAGVTGLIQLASLEKAIKERFKSKLQTDNLKLMRMAYCHTRPDDEYCYISHRKIEKLDDTQKFALNV